MNKKSTFEEIQASLRPLTKEEVNELARRRPHIWGRFVGWGK